jgi:hypothetical protein
MPAAQPPAKDLCLLLASASTGTRGPLLGRYGHKGNSSKQHMQLHKAKGEDKVKRTGNRRGNSSSSSAILRSKQQRHKAPGGATFAFGYATQLFSRPTAAKRARALGH